MDNNQYHTSEPARFQTIDQQFAAWREKRAKEVQEAKAAPPADAPAAKPLFPASDKHVKVTNRIAASVRGFLEGEGFPIAGGKYSHIAAAVLAYRQKTGITWHESRTKKQLIAEFAKEFNLIRAASKPNRQRRAASAEGFSPEYLEHIKSPKWKAFRRGIIRIRGRICERCGAAGKVQLHHLTYARLGHEEAQDVQLCCKDCHQAEHPHRQISNTGPARSSQVLT